MKRLHFSNSLVVLTFCFALISLAAFMSISAANLNYSTLQAIDGPVTARQIEALRLSSSLSSTSIGIIVGVIVAGLSAILLRRSSANASNERTSAHAA